MAEEIKTIIIDNWSSSTKTGFSSEKLPRKIFPTVIGRPKKDVYVGSELLTDNFLLDLDFPIQHGVITNWENMEIIYNHAFYKELRIEPSEYTIFVTESSNNTQPNREKLMEIMFETFNFNSFYSCNQGALSLYSTSKKDSGVVVEIGYGVCQIVPILNGRPISDSIVCNNLAGRDLTERLKQLLFKRNYSFTANSEDHIVNDIKKKLCYLSLDYETEIQKSKSDLKASYKLPDGKEIEVDEERISCPELLFKPHLNGFEFAGIDKSLFVAVNKVHPSHIKDMYSNVILSGGTSMFNGLQERIKNEISKLAPPIMKVNVCSANKQNCAAWIGAAYFASLENFNEMIITKKEYKSRSSQAFIQIFYYKWNKNFTIIMWFTKYFEREWFLHSSFWE